LIKGFHKLIHVGVAGRPVEESDALVVKKAYYVLGISIAGLSLILLNWLDASAMMFDLMNIKRIILGAMYYMVPMATALAGFTVTQLPATFLLNRVGNRMPMFLGLVLNGLSLIFSTTSSYHTALFLRFLAGMGLGLYLAPSLLLTLGWWSVRGLTRWIQVAYLSSITVLLAISTAMITYITKTTVLYLGVASIVLSMIVLFTMKDVVIIKSASIMAVMNNPDVLMLAIAFSVPWGAYLGLIPLTMHVDGTAGTVALTASLVLTPLLYKYRHAVRVERRKILFYATTILGGLMALMGIAPPNYVLVAVGFVFTVVLLSILYIINNLVSPILIVQSTSYLLTVSSTIGSIIMVVMGYAIQYLGTLGWITIGILMVISSLIYRILKITL